MSRTVEASFLIFLHRAFDRDVLDDGWHDLGAEDQECDDDQTDEDEPDQAHSTLPKTRSHVNLPLSFKEFSNITSS